MGRLGWIFVGALAVTACGGGAASFPFRYYGLKAKSYEGRLEGATDKDDLPLSRCAPTEGNATPCQVMLSPEVQRLKTAYRNLQIENEELQRRCPSAQ